MLKVIILGAGSSNDCGLPLGNEVWGYLDWNGPVPWQDFIRKIFPQFSVRFSPYPTFEMILTLIENHIRNSQNLGEYTSLGLQEIKRSLIKSYTDVFYKRCLYAEYKYSDYSIMPHAKFTYDNFNQWYKPFFKQVIEENSNIVFISINYDVLIDLVLNELSGKQNFTYGFDVYRLDEQKEKYRTSGILLLKPHGSINLAQCRKCGKVFAPVFSGQGIVSLIEDGHYKCDLCNETLDTLILPPLFNKAYKDEPFTIIHERIVEVISDADEILIIGYSLPDYDMNILEAFLSGALKNKKRFDLKIEVVDKNKNANPYLDSRYNNIFHRIKKENYFVSGFKKYTEQLCFAVKK
jgi:hypothetical protein